MSRKLLKNDDQFKSFVAVQTFLKENGLKSQAKNVEADAIIYIDPFRNTNRPNSFNTGIVIDYYEKYSSVNSKYTISMELVSKTDFKYDYIDTNYDKIIYDNDNNNLKFKVGKIKYILEPIQDEES